MAGSVRRATRAEKPGVGLHCPRSPSGEPICSSSPSPTHPSAPQDRHGAGLESTNPGTRQSGRAAGRMGRGQTSCAGHVTSYVTLCPTASHWGTAGRLDLVLHAA